MTSNIAIEADLDSAEDYEHELARVIRDIAARVEVGYDGGTVHDEDGNPIGTWAVNS